MHIRVDIFYNKYIKVSYPFSLGARSKSVNAASKKTDTNAAEDADMEAAIMAQLELALAGTTDSTEEIPAGKNKGVNPTP